jgi:hypothetical protein
VADTLADLTAGRMYRSISLTELGVRTTGVYVMTNTDATGAAVASSCTSWPTGNTNAFGEAVSVTGAWTAATTGADPNFCTLYSYPLYCLMKTHSTQLTPPAVPGKLMWISTTNASPTGGRYAMDLKCNSEKPGGVASGKAFVAIVGASAASRLTAGATYVTLLGQLIGTTTELQTYPLIPRAGISQQADGTFVNAPVLTGALGVLSAPSIGSAPSANCRDWSPTPVGYSDTYYATRSSFDGDWFFAETGTPYCTTAARVFCFEE